MLRQKRWIQRRKQVIKSCFELISFSLVYQRPEKVAPPLSLPFAKIIRIFYSLYQFLQILMLKKSKHIKFEIEIYCDIGPVN